MTGVDFPDWIPGQVPYQASRILWDNGGDYSPTPITSPTLDVSGFNSLDLQALVAGVSTQQYVMVQAAWIAGGNTVAIDNYSCGNAVSLGLGTGATLFRLPCKGDQVALSFYSDSSDPQVSVLAIGSTREIPAFDVSTNVRMDNLAAVVLTGVSVPAGTQKNYIVGPFPNGIRGWGTASLASGFLECRIPTFDLTTWAFRLAGVDPATINTGANVNYEFAGQILNVGAVNQNTAASSFTAALQGY